MFPPPSKASEPVVRPNERAYQFSFCIGRLHFLNWKAPRSKGLRGAHEWRNWRSFVANSESPQTQDPKDIMMKKYLNHRNVATLMRIAALAGLTQLGFNISPVFAATLSRSADVSGTVSAVWSMIGPFCAIKDWLPPVGTCTETGSSPAERILVTKDGKATFIEMQTARSEAEHSYSYTFKSSPLPVTDYTSTLKVVAKGDGVSTVTWSSTYVPNAGKEHDARKALTGIYESGLASIKAKFSK